jgi:hypothetical protein
MLFGTFLLSKPLLQKVSGGGFYPVQSSGRGLVDVEVAHRWLINFPGILATGSGERVFQRLSVHGCNQRTGHAATLGVASLHQLRECPLHASQVR